MAYQPSGSAPSSGACAGWFRAETRAGAGSADALRASMSAMEATRVRSSGTSGSGSGATSDLPLTVIRVPHLLHLTATTFPRTFSSAMVYLAEHLSQVKRTGRPLLGDPCRESARRCHRRRSPGESAELSQNPSLPRKARSICFLAPPGSLPSPGGHLGAPLALDKPSASSLFRPASAPGFPGRPWVPECQPRTSGRSSTASSAG